MKLVDEQTMRQLDARTIAETALSGSDLMLRAGEGIADALMRLAQLHQIQQPTVLFFAGCGNNGGDAFVAANALHEQGWGVCCLLAGKPDTLKAEALGAYKQAIKSGIEMVACPEPEDWSLEMDADILVDALLGTGVKGAPYGVMAAAIDRVNQLADEHLMVSIDLPSAMQVRADITLSLGLPKRVLAQEEMAEVCGRIEVIDIGIPTSLVEQVDGAAEELLVAQDVCSLFKRRLRRSHKGTYGHLLCVGGSYGMSGAISLAAQAGMRSGAGWVSVQTDASVQGTIAVAVPEAMVADRAPEKEVHALLIGPGMGYSEQVCTRVLEELTASDVPLVIDADAFTVLKDHIEVLSQVERPIVLTPHPGEFATLFGIEVDEVEADRVAMARMAAMRLGVVVILKGCRTIIASPEGQIAINSTGNPGMASAGMGDLLAGLVGGLLAQSMPPFQASCAAVWLHGMAGDVAAAHGAEPSLIASDLLTSLPDAFRQVMPR
jgi:NAD(P)H-hydrate epimerase